MFRQLLASKYCDYQQIATDFRRWWNSIHDKIYDDNTCSWQNWFFFKRFNQNFRCSGKAFKQRR